MENDATVSGHEEKHAGGRRSSTDVDRRRFLKAVGGGAGALVISSCASLHGRNDGNSRADRKYYVDSFGGDDSNSGRGPSEPWRSLKKVNATTFQPGDSILFKAGGMWSGMLHPQGSGTQEKPITIGRYGPDAAPAPIINGDGDYAAVYLHNQEYWEIRHLELTNMADQVGNRAGVRVEAERLGRKAHHIHLENLHIHDVQGDYPTETGGDYRGQDTGGVIFQAIGPAREGTRWDDVRVEGCTIASVDRVGIRITSKANHSNAGGASSRVVVQNNTISNAGGDGGIFIGLDGTSVIQHNVAHDLGLRVKGEAIAGLWTWSCHGTVIQKNEVYRTQVPQRGGDGQAFDTDGNDREVIYQYNYSHNNEGGFMLFIANEAIVRYNISQNDGYGATTKRDPGGLITFTAWRSKNSHIYNNTFYIKKGMEVPIVDGIPRDRGPTYFSNNIIYNLGKGYYNPKMNVVYDYNLYYGNHPETEPEDPHKLTADPLLVAPGTGGTGRDSVNGYETVWRS